MDGLKVLGGDRVRVPEKRRLEVDESCKYNVNNSKFSLIS